MRERHILTLIAAAAILATASARGAEGVELLDRDAIIEAARTVTAEAYPNADDVLVDDHMVVEYAADGTSSVREDEVYKILTEKGKRANQTFTLGFTLPYSTVRVDRVEIIHADGQVTPVDVAAQTRITIDRAQMSQNIYNPNSKLMRVGIPGLEIGDCLRLITQRTTMKARVPNTWSDYRVFEYTAPLRHVKYQVTGPASLPLCNIALRDEIPGTVTHSVETLDDKIRHTWEVRDVPRMYREPDMPALHTVVQRLLVSTIPDWRDISRWYWELSLPHLDATSPRMAETVAELCDGADTRAEKVDALFTFVAQKIRYMGITTEKEAPGYEPHDVKTTFENRYGVCRDKAALLVAMLREAGLSGYPVLIHAGEKKDEEVPQPFFNHAIVALENEDGSFTLMDPTDENATQLLPSYLCNKSYLVAHPEGRTLLTSAIVPATNNLLRINTTGALEPDGSLHMVADLAFDGANDRAYRSYFSRIKPLERRRFFEGLIKRRFAGAALSVVDIQPTDLMDIAKPFSVKLEFAVPDFLVQQDDYALAVTPWLGTGVGYVNFVLGRTGLDTRKYPMVTHVACGVRETFTIQLDDAVGSPLRVPEYKPIEEDAFSFALAADIHSNVWQGTSSFLVKAVEFSPEEYLSLKQSLKDIEFERRKKPIFRTDTVDAGGNDIRILEDELAVELFDAQNWKARWHTRKKVLTFAGKKRSAELKLPFNPVWSDMQVENARITNPDGTVHEVVAEEVNVMDAGWVGSAPRYPAERVMVVSLPGVEVGSTIEYDILSTASNRPFFSFRQVFADFEPTDVKTLRVTAPREVELKLGVAGDGSPDLEQSTADGRLVRTWTVHDLAPIRREDSLPPLWTYCDGVLLSTGDWSTYAKQAWAALESAAQDQPDAARRAAELSDKVDEDAESRIKAIRDFVVRNVRPAGPGFDALPLSCVTPADQTLREGYGHSADRAVVLHAMLSAIGLQPEFVLTSSSAPRIAAQQQLLLEYPQRSTFDTVLVRVSTADGFVYLNDTDQYARLGSTPHDGRPCLYADGTTGVVAALPAMRERTALDYTIQLDSNGDALITSKSRYYGMGHAAFHKHYVELPPEERRRQFLELIAGVSQAAKPVGKFITDFETYPGEMSFTVRVPRFAVRDGEYLQVSLPAPLGEGLRFRADQRTGPLYRPTPLETETRYEVELPASLQDVMLQPEPISWTDGAAGLGFLELDTQVVNGENSRVLAVRRTARLDPTIIPANRYPALLQIQKDFAHARTRLILLKATDADNSTPDNRTR